MTAFIDNTILESQLDTSDKAYIMDVLDRARKIYSRWDWPGLHAEGFSKTGDYCFIYSYPPVRTLSAVDGATLLERGEYGDLDEECSIYIHIPYCTAICSYCYFAKTVDKGAPVPRSDYPDLLDRELALHLDPSGCRPTVRSVHFGGGTPSLLTPQELARIMETLSRRVNLRPDAEITLECAPETIVQDPGKLLAYKRLGVNRLNLGVESLDDVVLRKMGRRHGAASALQALSNMFDAGYDNINVDVIYGLPGQTVESWIATLRLLEQRQVHSVSAYRLRRHPKKAISRLDISAYPSYEDGLLMQFAHGIVLEDAGFIRSSSHKYARGEDKLQKQVEEKRGVSKSQLLSLGCGAYGFVNDTFYWNTKSLVDYAADVRANRLPVWIGQRLTKDELMRKAMVTGMHTNRGVSIADFRERFAEDPRNVFSKELLRLNDLGVLEERAGHITSTEIGRFFSDELSLQFYSAAVKSKLEALGMRYGMFFEKDRYA